MAAPVAPQLGLGVRSVEAALVAPSKNPPMQIVARLWTGRQRKSAMHSVRLSITSVSLAFLVAACGTSQPAPQTTEEGSGGNNAATTSDQNGNGGAKSTASSKSTSGGSKSTASKTTTGKGGSTATSQDNEGGASEGGQASGEGGSKASSSSKVSSSSTKAGSSSTGGKSGSSSDKATGGTTSTETATGGTGAGTQGGAGTKATTTVAVEEPTLVTSAQGAFWKVGAVTEVTSGNANVTVNDSSAKQEWTGFGGTFNERGWEVLQLLSAADRETAIKLLFDAVEGANFAYGRIPIGASDYYVGSKYTLNDNANDEKMEKFSIERDKKLLIPYIKAALAVKPDIKLWGSPWTPPPWMKTPNSSLDSTGYNGGKMKDTAFGAFALYLAKFVEEYGKEGMTITAVHPQNEPGYFNNDYPCCEWTGDQMKTFIGKHMGPVFAERNVKAEIWAGTMSAPEDSSKLSTILNDAEAMKYVKGAGLQWNTVNAVGTARSKNIPAMQTEHKCGNYDWVSGYNANKAPNDFAYAQESWNNIKEWINAGVSSYSAWNMVLDTIGNNMNETKKWPQNAPLTVDTGAKKLIITPAYYVFRHLSQYVDPGAKVVGTSGGDALAFKNPDGSIVAVLYNSGSAGKQIIAIGGKKLQFDMPGSGWATINWKG